MKFCLSAAHGAHVMSCDIGAAAAAAFDLSSHFSPGDNPVKLHGIVIVLRSILGYYDAFAFGAGCSAGRNLPSSLEGAAPRDRGALCGKTLD